MTKVPLLSSRPMRHLHLWAMWLTTHVFGSTFRRSSGTSLWRDSFKITWCGCSRWLHLVTFYSVSIGSSTLCSVDYRVRWCSIFDPFSPTSCPPSSSITPSCWTVPTVNWCRVSWRKTTVCPTPALCCSSWTRSTTLPVAGHALCLRSVVRKPRSQKGEKKQSFSVSCEKKRMCLIENNQERKLIRHNLLVTQGAQMSLLSNVGFYDAVECFSLPKWQVLSTKSWTKSIKTEQNTADFTILRRWILCWPFLYPFSLIPPVQD